MNVKNFDSGTDVSSDSSWTVIEEIPENSISDIDNDSKSNRNVSIELIETTEIITIPDSNDEEKFVKVNISKEFVKHSSDESSDSSKNEIRGTGFISFEEYSQEWMLVHDNPCQIQSKIRMKLNKPKNPTKITSKCEAKTIIVLSLCASLLTVICIALLFIISPDNIDPKNFESMRNNYQAMAENYSLDTNNIVGSLNKTMEVLQAATASNISITSAYNLNNIPDLASKCSIGPMKETRSIRYQRKNQNQYNMSASIFPKNISFTKIGNRVCYSNEDPRLFAWNSKKKPNRLEDKKKLNRGSYSTIIETTNQNNTRKALYPIESVLNGTNLKNVIRSIIHDICILKLITYLNKNLKSQEQNKKPSKGEKKQSKRKLSGETKDGLDVIQHDDITGRKTRTAKRKTNIDNQFPSHQYR